MAVTKDDLVIAIEVQGGKAAKEIQKVTNELEDLNKEMKVSRKSQEETSSAVSGVGFAMIKLQAAVELAKQAYEVYNKTIKETINAYNQQLDMERKVANALAINGRFTKAALDNMRDFATQMQDTTTLGDDLVLNLAAQALATGRTEEQTKKLIKASAGLAALNKKDVNSVFEQLLETYKGTAGAAEKYDVTLKALTEAQLKAGGAVDQLAAKFSKMATEDINTVEGRAKQAANSFGELQEAIGEVVTKTFNLGAGSNLLKDIYDDLTKVIQDHKNELIAFGKGVISFFDDVITVIKLYGDTYTGLFNGITAGFNRVLLVYQETLNGLGVVSDEAVTATKKKIEESLKEAGKSFESFKTNFSTFGEADKEIEKVATGIGNVTSSAEKLNEEFKGTNRNLTTTTEKAKAAFEELQKFVSDLSAKVNLIGKGRADQLKATSEAELASLKVIEDKLKAEGGLNAAARERLSTARELIQAEFDKTLAEERRKINEEFINQNKEMMIQAKQADALAQDAIAMELDRQLDLLEVKRKQLEIDGLLTDEINSRIAAQGGLLKGQAARASEAAPTREFEAPMKAGAEIAKTISDAFGGLSGMVSGVGAVVSAATAVVDMVPQMINSITDLVNKITDLPIVLMDAVVNLLGSLDRFVAEFIPNIITATEGILDAAVGFIEKFPETFATMLERIPDMLLRLLDRLPSIVERLIPALIAAIPKIAITLTKFLIKDAPKIAWEIMKVMSVELPIAIIKGFAEGIKQMGKAITGMFSKIKLPKIENIIDPVGLTKSLKHAFAKLSGETSKLFAVQDLGTSAREKAKDLTDKLTEAGNEALRKSKDFWDWLKGLWDKFLELLKTAWMWVWNKIIQPFLTLLQKLWDGLKSVVAKAWKFVSDLWEALKDIVAVAWKVVSDLWETLKDVVARAWQFVSDLWGTLKDIVAKAWQFVSDLWEALKTKVSEAWQFVSDLWEALKSKVSEAWQFVSDLWEGLKDKVSNAFQGVQDFFNTLKEKVFGPIISALGTVFDLAESAFSGVFGGLKSAVDKLEWVFNTVIKPIFDAFGGALKAVANGFVGIFNALIKVLNALKIGPLGYNISAGKLGSWSGDLIPQVDFIPGNINEIPTFAKGGLVPGNSPIKGDSALNDTILAMLSPGEAVIPRSLMDNPLVANLVQGILAGRVKIPMMATGGVVGPASMSDNEFINNRSFSGSTFYDAPSRNFNQGSVTNNYTVTMKIENNGAMDENFVKNRLIPTIKQQLRADTSRGELVINKRGVF